MASANPDGAEKVYFNKGRYEVIERIGGGSFGVVYLALDKEQIDRYAIEIL